MYGAKKRIDCEKRKGINVTMSFIKQIFKFDNKIDILNGFVSLLILIISGLYLKNPLFGIIYGAVYFVLKNIKIKTESKSLNWVINVCGSICLVVATYFVSFTTVSSKYTIYADFKAFCLNFICIFLVCGLIFVVSAKWKLSCAIGCGLLLLLSAINGVVYAMRGNELSFNDFLSVKTAMNVASQYEFNVPKLMVHGVILWILFLSAYLTLPKIPQIAPLKSRAVAAILETVLFALLVSVTNNMKIETWKNYGTTKNGYYLNFFLTVKDHDMKKNSGYDIGLRSFIDTYVESEEENSQLNSSEQNNTENNNPESSDTMHIHSEECELNGCNSDKLISDFQKHNFISENADSSSAERPNIIIIMNESFSDYRILGDGVTTNIPVMPYIDSLKENTVKGYALSSVFGGNTANSEFELLTSHSMCFMPTDSVPYQQFISDSIHTLPWYLASLGYKTVSTHPYGKTGWSRDRLYPKLGFSESTFLEDYSGAETIRNYVKDIEVYKKIINRLNEEPSDSPMFIFGITMQNHGGYTYEGDNFQKTVEIVGAENQYPLAEQYLTLINESDKAVEYLLTELQNYEEETIVLFFGDHFPKIEAEFYEKAHEGTFETQEERLLQYKIPFFIWANYDIEDSYIDCTSINYLASLLLDTANVSKSPYYTFLTELRQVVPAINSLGYYSISKQEFIDYNLAENEEKEWLNIYYSVQYNNLHPKERNYEIFGRYTAPNNNQRE